MAKKNKAKNPPTTLAPASLQDVAYVHAQRTSLIGAAQAALDAQPDVNVNGYDLVTVQAMGGFFICHQFNRKIITAIHVKYEQFPEIAPLINSIAIAVVNAITEHTKASNEEAVALGNDGDEGVVGVDSGPEHVGHPTTLYNNRDEAEGSLVPA